MLRTRKWSAVLLSLAAPFAVSGCSLALQFEQCESDDDCARFDDALQCSQDKVCVDPGGDDGGPQTQCSHAECGAEDPNFVCGAAGECVSVLSPECSNVVLPSTRDNMILFGSIQPTTGDAASAGIPQENAAILAFKEFNESGLLGDLRIGLIGCDSAGDTERGLDAARHLVDTLGVPAIVGPAFSGIFIETTSSVTVPAGVMTISGSATSEVITSIPDMGLAWRTIASDSFQSVAIVDRVRDLRAMSDDPASFKVAAFGKNDAYGSGLLNAVTEVLEPELGADNYFGVLHPDVNDDTGAEIGTVVASALDSDFADADVVLLLGTNEIVDVLESYELYLDTNNLTDTPLYVMSDGGKIDETIELVAGNNALQDRIEGTIPSLENGAIYTGFRQRYSAEFGTDPDAFASNAYDAAYLLAYGGVSLRPTNDDPPLTGAELAAFMSRVISGQVTNAGPAAIASALNTLEAGATIDFEGASGLLAFDLATGEAPSNVDRYVIDFRAADDVRFMDEGQYQVAADGSGEWIGIEE